MRITFDPAKESSNMLKHGVPLALAAAIDWQDVLSAPDDRKDYGELREIGFAPIGERLFCVVFTQRGDTMHVISLRKANAREVRNYAQHR